MAKVTSKLQVTIPKALADEYGIRAGSEIRWVGADEAIHLVPQTRSARSDRSTTFRIRLFDAATERQLARQPRTKRRAPSSRGWTREELYRRGRPG